MFTNLLDSEIKDRQLLAEKFVASKYNKLPNTWTWYSDDNGVYFVEMGRKRYSVLKDCLYCQRNFCVRKAYSETHNTCSQLCSSKMKEVERKDLVCAWCKKSFLRKESRLNNSKTGLYFCNRICKENAQQIGGLPEIQPDHYKDGAASYSDRALRHYGSKCCDCNITLKFMLVVHHRDGDRSNGDIKNLEVVCANHHLIRHMFYDEKTKSWVMSYNKLTPREKLKEIKELLEGK